ncbi:MAG: hypothetical protein JW893_06040 [Candidatus Omnitrophica bacterium]|nr:hypothetical protein [Candidatus Omnitrophota bacterium]
MRSKRIRVLKRVPIGIIFLGLSLNLFILPHLVTAQTAPVLYPGFAPIEESKAYLKFLESPKSDYAKILFLIDRFGEADAEIIYEGYVFSTTFAAHFARQFLSRQYRGETPEKWIMRWCNTSVIKGELIWVRLPNQKYKLSREVLLEEVKVLEECLKGKPVS